MRTPNVGQPFRQQVFGSVHVIGISSPTNDKCITTNDSDVYMYSSCATSFHTWFLYIVCVVDTSVWRDICDVGYRFWIFACFPLLKDQARIKNGILHASKQLANTCKRLVFPTKGTSSTC